MTHRSIRYCHTPFSLHLNNPFNISYLARDNFLYPTRYKQLTNSVSIFYSFLHTILLTIPIFSWTFGFFEVPLHIRSVFITLYFKHLKVLIFADMAKKNASFFLCLYELFRLIFILTT